MVLLNGSDYHDLVLFPSDQVADFLAISVLAI